MLKPNEINFANHWLSQSHDGDAKNAIPLIRQLNSFHETMLGISKAYAAVDDVQPTPEGAIQKTLEALYPKNRYKTAFPRMLPVINESLTYEATTTCRPGEWVAGKMLLAFRPFFNEAAAKLNVNFHFLDNAASNYIFQMGKFPDY